MKTFSDFSVTTITGDALPLSSLAGGVTLVVNVASQCGLTPQYAGLETLWRTYRAQGLTVIGCPCNQFGDQEPGSEATIVQFCSTRYDVTFPLTAKLCVNGDDAHPVWAWMKQTDPACADGTPDGAPIKWNFAKFLVGRDGRVLERFSSMATAESMAPAIERALAVTSAP